MVDTKQYENDMVWLRRRGGDNFTIHDTAGSWMDWCCIVPPYSHNFLVCILICR